MRAEISGFAQGIRNAEQATNLIQTAEGSLGEINGILIRMRELSVQSAFSTVNDENRTAVNAEFTQLVNEIDRIAQVTAYNNSSLLSGYGNTVSNDAAVSTVLASTTTGVIQTHISGAQTSTYQISDSAGNNSITLGNGVTTQTINTAVFLDSDSVGGVVASGSSAVANFDRLGIQLTLSGQKAAAGINPATDGYRDGDLDGLSLVIESGTGGIFQVGPDEGAVHTVEINISDMRASGAHLSLSGLSVSTLTSAQSSITAIDVAIQNVTNARGDLGAVQNRLSQSMRATGVMLENDQASDSSI